MKKNENELKKLLDGLEIDARPRAEHRNRLREKMLATFKETIRPAPVVIRSGRWRYLERAGVLAAGVVIGLGVGLLVPREAEKPQAITIVKTIVQPTHSVSEAESNDEISNGLWSVARFRKRVLAPRPKSKLRVNWTSPIRKPQLGEIQ